MWARLQTNGECKSEEQTRSLRTPEAAIVAAPSPVHGRHLFLYGLARVGNAKVKNSPKDLYVFHCMHGTFLAALLFVHHRHLRSITNTAPSIHKQHNSALHSRTPYTQTTFIQESGQLHTPRKVHQFACTSTYKETKSPDNKVNSLQNLQQHADQEHESQGEGQLWNGSTQVT